MQRSSLPVSFLFSYIWYCCYKSRKYCKKVTARSNIFQYLREKRVIERNVCYVPDHLDGEIVYASLEITRWNVEISAYKFRSKNIRRDKIVYLRTAMHVQRSIVIIRALVVYTHRYLAPKSLCTKQQVLLVEALRRRWRNCFVLV